MFKVKDDINQAKNMNGCYLSYRLQEENEIILEDFPKKSKMTILKNITNNTAVLELSKRQGVFL